MLCTDIIYEGKHVWGHSETGSAPPRAEIGKIKNYYAQEVEDNVVTIQQQALHCQGQAHFHTAGNSN